MIKTVYGIWHSGPWSVIRNIISKKLSFNSIRLQFINVEN